jgi:hypothetical protein
VDGAVFIPFHFALAAANRLTNTVLEYHFECKMELAFEFCHGGWFLRVMSWSYYWS